MGKEIKKTVQMAVLFGVLLFSGKVFAAGTLVMAVEEYPPYEYTADGIPMGMHIEIIQIASERLGIKADIRFYPWARALEMVKTGEVDTIFSLFKTPEREAFLYYPGEPLANEKNILITHKNSTKEAKSLEDIAGWKIGIVRESAYGKEFDAYPNITRHEVAHIEQLIKMAAAGNRFDATPVNEYVFAYKVKELGLTGQFKKLDFTVSDEPLYIGFSKAKGPSHKKLAEDYSQVLMQLRKEGIIDKIIQKYTTF